MRINNSIEKVYGSTYVTRNGNFQLKKSIFCFSRSPFPAPYNVTLCSFRSPTPGRQSVESSLFLTGTL